MAATAVRVLARGLAHRGGSTLAVFVVALVAAAAAAIGPAYYVAAQTSILRDTLTSAPASARGIEISAQTNLPGALAQLKAATDPVVARALPSAVSARVFAPLVEAVEGTLVLPDPSHSAAPLVTRTGFCAHLRMLSGRCATATGEVVLSSSSSTLTGIKVGRRFSNQAWGTLTVVGIYAVPDPALPYWFGRGGTYFGTEDSGGTNSSASPGLDALFTPAATLIGRGQPQGTVVIDRLLRPDAVRAGDLSQLSGAVQRLQRAATAGGNLIVVSELPGLQHDVRASWHALEVSILLITVQLLVLVWLLMFTVVGDAIALRGPEIALMKLRGRRGLALLTFALGEPLLLLALALPAGVALGASVCVGLDSVLLRPDTAAALPWTAWLAALAATVGGLVATVVAGRRTLRRGVLDQWQHAAREATRRGWLIDSIVVTAAVAAIAELVIGGQVTSSHAGTLGLLVPGVLGLAVAVVASRLLPWLCRRAFARTRSRGGLGAFLAVRQVARRSAGARTTVVLAAAFALATFAVAAWSTGQSNRRLAADVQVGAPSVLTVVPPGGRADLGAIVDKLDPHGTRAAVVDSYYPGAGTVGTMLAVDPQRFAHVVAWRPDFAAQSVTTLMRRLAPPAAAPVPIDGDAVRVRLDVHGLKPVGTVLGLSLATPGSDGAVNAELGTIPRETGTVTLAAGVGGCPCTLSSIDLAAATAGNSGFGIQIHGQLTLDGIDVHDASGWHALGGLQSAARWRQLTGTDVDPEQTLSVSGGRLVWPVDFSATNSGSLAVADYPAALPAVVSRTTPSGPVGSVVPTLGLDGNNVQIRSLARASAVPGAPSGGVIVDRTYAERAAAGVLSGPVQQQVWVADGAHNAIAAGLRRAGVKITATQSAAQQTRLLNRQGPGLASTVLLADALAAALLAAGGALAALITAARRRRFEYAALGVVGASRRSLYAGLLIEQAAVLVFGALAGVVAGVAAALLALRSVPEFVQAPASVALHYPLPTLTLTLFVVGAVVVLFALAAGTSAGLLAGASPDRLREVEE